MNLNNFFSVTLLSDILRAAALVAGMIAFFIGRGSAGIFILATLLATLIFKKRKFVMLDNSQSADWWEFGVVLLFSVNAVLLVTGLYYSMRLLWVDIPMHFWGGALAGVWTYLALLRKRNIPIFEQALILFGVVALVGVGWEFFEWVADHLLGQWYVFPRNQPSVDDVLGDLFMDLLGGAVGWVLIGLSWSQNKLEISKETR